MISWRRHPERLAAAATALLLQGALYWTLSPHHPSPTGTTKRPTLRAFLLATTRPRPAAPPPLHAGERLTPIAVTDSPIARPITPSEPQSRSSRSPIDWPGAIRGEVRAELSRAEAPSRLRFGLPRMRAKEAPPAFGWDEVRLNRLHRLVHGVIDLGDGCLIEVWPPFAGCFSGPANGDLFEHMHDPRHAAPHSLP